MLPETLQLQTGTSGDDVLNGGPGSDFLSGGPVGQGGVTGQDTINGNGGDDYLLAFNASSNGIYTNNNYSGSVFDGGAGKDYLVVSGQVFFQGQIRSIEGIDLDPAWSGDQPSAGLETGPDMISQLPANTSFMGSGYVEFHMDSTLVLYNDRTRTFDTYYIGTNPIHTFNGSGYVFEPGSSIRMLIHGTGDADTITGTSGNDYIDSQGGNDWISGGPGNDKIAGWDNPSGYAQPDVVFNGDAGDDTLSGSSGHSVLFGGVGNDSITGGSGFSQVNGNQGDDTIIGHSTVGDWLLGGQGNDLIDVSGASAPYAYGGNPASTGANILNGNLGADTIVGGAGADSLRGGQGDDVIRAGSGADWISGDLGNNTIHGGQGADIFHAGPGHDLVDGWHAGDEVQVAAGVTYTVTQAGADVHIVFSNGGEMDLVGIQQGSLPSGWIVSS